MFRSFMSWLGFGNDSGRMASGHAHFSHHSHEDGPRKEHSHVHGVVDPGVMTSERGIWALKWSFGILWVTATLELAVYLAAGSVALLADTIHNFTDAMTAIPLWIAFRLARKRPVPRFTYGYGRVEDFAGIVIVLIILANVFVVGTESVERFLHPEPVLYLGWVALAGLIGFAGNEAAAMLRIRVGREIQSAALVSDGYHARTDGLASLAVVAGAAAVRFGFPLADPIIGMFIAITILGIVWQSAKWILVRMLDGVEPGLVEEIRGIVSSHDTGIGRDFDIRARWIGHRLSAELDIGLPSGANLLEADGVVRRLKDVLYHHIPALSDVRVFVRPLDGSDRKDGEGIPQI
jgi:cation diffusion facilitator family transporter